MPTPMTAHGEKLLQEELAYLKGTRRPEVSKAIESKLSDAKVIDIKQMPNTGRVIFGTTVTLENAETGEQTVYQIVGDDEADIKSKKISCNAPLSRAIMGKELDDEIDFTTPDDNVTTYVIIKIEHI